MLIKNLMSRTRDLASYIKKKKREAKWQNMKQAAFLINLMRRIFKLNLRQISSLSHIHFNFVTFFFSFIKGKKKRTGKKKKSYSEKSLILVTQISQT